jgi:hypothetical protein
MQLNFFDKIQDYDVASAPMLTDRRTGSQYVVSKCT